MKHCVTCIHRLACLQNASPINETALAQSVTCIIHVTGVVMVDRPKTYRGSSHAHAGVLSTAPLTSSLKDARVIEVTLSHDPSGTAAVALLVLIVLVFVQYWYKIPYRHRSGNYSSEQYEDKVVK